MASSLTISKVWRELVAAFPNNKIGEDTAIVYAATLKDIDDDALQAGALDCLARCKFFPTIAELREASFSVMSARIAQPSALEAWGEVRAMVERHGYYRTPDVTDFSNQAAGETILTLGWQAFCLSETGDEMSWRARFVELYEAKQARDRELGRMLPEVRRAITRRLGGATLGQAIAGLIGGRR